ncbi:sigma-54-dependent transcriptional regulator [Planctomyces sp. SH-PL14]|uniref:sigma-54-dependent transcriptional regulator n=1 Tax=Planctomyces sp. SH-PL14 TaxID=1632864 RepID=UPI00078B4E93|nr:sigma-54 dependent transcriptional regulator [Planctomyces sp. SH-PL14]AMV20043.1 Transcriptional regulatory protein ZraR [Planctomyces sp. SH-PL14]
MGQVLIVDDEPTIAWAFQTALKEEGFSTDIASSAEDGFKRAGQRTPDVIVLDVRLPGIDGLKAVEHFKEIAPRAHIVIITAFGSFDVAVRAVESGAFDYLPKPFDLDQAILVVKRAFEASRPPVRVVETNDMPPPETLIGRSHVMQQVFKQIALVADSDVPVLIVGESGTGKELVAEAIHRCSQRRHRPFVPVCVAAYNETVLESELFGHSKGAFTGADRDRTGVLDLAEGGTVLLDEVGDIPLPQQVKLLRAIERREVTPVGTGMPHTSDFRVVAATNRPLLDLVTKGEFREDLYFRLRVFQIELPPLRERKEDIPLLAEYFVRRISTTRAKTLSPEAIAELSRREWYGNVRELRNAVEHAAIVSRTDVIGVESLPPPLPPHREALVPVVTDWRDGFRSWCRDRATELVGLESAELYDTYLAETEPVLLEESLEQCGGNRAATARMLGIHRATLREKLKRYHGQDEE